MGEEKKILKVNELFSGVGAQAKALERLNVPHEIVCTSDVDKDAIVSYAAIHCGLTLDMVDTYAEYPSRKEMADYLTKLNIGLEFSKGENKPYDWYKLVNRKNKNLEKYWLAVTLSNCVGDISRLDKLPKADMWTYSFPCFTGDTLVLTESKGYIPIKDIQSGDKVITHTNEYCQVTDSKCTGNKEIWHINAMLADKIECTENHQFYVRTRHRVSTKVHGQPVHYRWFNNPIWKQCKDLCKDDYLGYAINQKSIIPEWNGIDFKWNDGRKTRHKNNLSDLMSNKDFWWIIGRYIADGWCRKQGGIIICCGKSKQGQIEPHLKNCGFNYCVSEERTVIKYHIPLKELQAFVMQFGYKAYGKFVPAFVFDMPVDLLETFLDGYMSGDGCFTHNLYKASSVSITLIYGIGHIVAKVYRRPFSIYSSKRKPQTVIEGRTVNQKEQYCISFKKQPDIQDKAFYENGFIWFPIHKIENTHIHKDVYDITVEQNHSFTANGAIVHNCTDISVAGKQEGIIDGTRSGLLLEVERLLLKSAECGELPDYLQLENVKNLVGKKFIKDFYRWLDFLESLGYRNYWQVMNAKDYGVPQNRERVFCISIKRELEQDYEFPKPVPLDKRLKDVLESNVDEKYYLSPESLENFQTCFNEKIGGVNLSKCGKQIENEVQTAMCLMARDYKGFGNQMATGVYELEQ